MLAADEYSKTHPLKVSDLHKINIVEQLKELNKLKESGGNTEAEFKKQKNPYLKSNI